MLSDSDSDFVADRCVRDTNKRGKRRKHVVIEDSCEEDEKAIEPKRLKPEEEGEHTQSDAGQGAREHVYLKSLSLAGFKSYRLLLSPMKQDLMPFVPQGCCHYRFRAKQMQVCGNLWTKRKRQVEYR